MDTYKKLFTSHIADIVRAGCLAVDLESNKSAKSRKQRKIQETKKYRIIFEGKDKIKEAGWLARPFRDLK